MIMIHIVLISSIKIVNFVEKNLIAAIFKYISYT